MAVHMRMVSLAVMLVGVFAGSWTTLRAVRRRSRDLPRARRRAPSATYCAGCHNGVMRSPSGALLDQFDATRIAENPDAWTRAYRQLQAGTMPPVGARRPDRATYDAIVRSIETALRANVPPQADATSLEIAERLAAAPVEQRARRVAARGCAAQPADRPAVSKRQIRRMLADERARAFVDALLLPVAGTRSARQGRPGQGALSRLRRVPARRHGDGNRAVHPQSAPRGPRPRWTCGARTTRS